MSNLSNNYPKHHYETFAQSKQSARIVGTHLTNSSSTTGGSHNLCTSSSSNWLIIRNASSLSLSHVQPSLGGFFFPALPLPCNVNDSTLKGKDPGRTNVGQNRKGHRRSHAMSSLRQTNVNKFELGKERISKMITKNALEEFCVGNFALLRIPL